MKFPEAFGMLVTVDDMESARQFYADLYPHDEIKNGVFGGIDYFSIMRDGETVVNIFKKCPENPMADSLPILKVDSVADFEAKIKKLGGRTVISPNHCPCTETPFAICEDANGCQFMIKQPRSF